MPKKPAHPCNWPGCGELTHKRYCDEHSKEYGRQRRKETPPALYGRRWGGIRNKYLGIHPFCEYEGCDKVAVEVHHIIPLKAGGTHSMNNLQALCKRHHTLVEESRRK